MILSLFLNSKRKINLKCKFFNAFCCYTIRLQFITVICIAFGCKAKKLALLLKLNMVLN